MLVRPTKPRRSWVPRVPRAPTSSTGRKARERAARCTEVLAVARRLYGRKGYQRTTMAEIARASELAIGTLYQLFPSKEAILCGLLEERVTALIAHVRHAADAAADTRTRVEHIVRSHLAFSLENADVLRLYLSGWVGYDSTIRHRFGDRLDAKYEEYLDLLASVLRPEARDGVQGARSPQRLALALAGMIHALIRRWLRQKDVDLLGEGEAILDIFLHGALTRERPAGRHA